MSDLAEQLKARLAEKLAQSNKEHPEDVDSIGSGETPREREARLMNDPSAWNLCSFGTSTSSILLR